MSTNVVVLIGRLTADPEVRTTQTGKQVANFTLAVQRRFKGADGVECDFFRTITWGNSADFVANYLGKGRLVAVEGRLQARKYTTQDGDNREVVEVVAESVQGLDRPRDDQPEATRSAQADGDAMLAAARQVFGNGPTASAQVEDSEFDPFSD